MWITQHCPPQFSVPYLDSFGLVETGSASDTDVRYSDRGSQYLSIRYTERLSESEIERLEAGAIPMTTRWPNR